MKVLFVSPRYGSDVAGGAEALCRAYATRLAHRGHDVSVLTSRATRYTDWADDYPAGTSTIDGVRVHRLGVNRERDDESFSVLNARVGWGNRPLAPLVQREWMRLQGPDLDGFSDACAELAGAVDVVAAMPYLYNTTWEALHACRGRAPTVLIPAAHDEPPLSLPIFQSLFRLPDAIAVSTPEEGELVAERFGRAADTSVVGIGIDAGEPASPDPAREALGLGDDPYLLYAGRIDPAKGTEELFDFFVALRRRAPELRLKLVLLGEQVRPLPPHPDVVCPGFVSDDVRDSAMAGALAVVVPSYFESFSLLLCDGWAQRRPALVQGRCAVLRGQVRRSGGGLAYEGFTSFETAVRLLLEDPSGAEEMGSRGRSYVLDRYEWQRVLDDLELVLERAA